MLMCPPINASTCQTADLSMCQHVNLLMGYTKTRDTSDDRDERDGITSDESTIYRDDDIYVTAIFVK